MKSITAQIANLLVYKQAAATLLAA